MSAGVYKYPRMVVFSAYAGDAIGQLSRKLSWEPKEP